jgi:thiamine-monophosphate kinase
VELPGPELTLGDLGEDKFIDLLATLLVPGTWDSPKGDIGIGDDAAVLSAPPPGHRIVLTADAFVEGTHFLLPHQITPALDGLRPLLARGLNRGMGRARTRMAAETLTQQQPVGTAPGALDTVVESRRAAGLVPSAEYREFGDSWALATGHRLAMANLSDLAAMGAHPRALTLTLAASGQVSARTAALMALGIHLAGQAAGAPLVGGDTVKTTGPLCLSVQAVGTLDGEAPLRANAQPGDRLYLTGCVGCGILAPTILLGRYPGLAMLVGGRESRRDMARVIVRNQTSPPRLRAGRTVAATSTPHPCATDVSDGLWREAWRIARAARVHITLTVETIPVHPAAARLLADLTPEQRLAQLFSSGEEWELLTTHPLPDATPISLPLQPHPEGLVTAQLKGREIKIQDQTYGHFSHADE